MIIGPGSDEPAWSFFLSNLSSSKALDIPMIDGMKYIPFIMDNSFEGLKFSSKYLHGEKIHSRTTWAQWGFFLLITLGNCLAASHFTNRFFLEEFLKNHRQTGIIHLHLTSQFSCFFHSDPLVY